VCVCGTLTSDTLHCSSIAHAWDPWMRHKVRHNWHDTLTHTHAEEAIHGMNERTRGRNGTNRKEQKAGHREGGFRRTPPEVKRYLTCPRDHVVCRRCMGHPHQSPHSQQNTQTAQIAQTAILWSIGRRSVWVHKRQNAAAAHRIGGGMVTHAAADGIAQTFREPIWRPFGRMVPAGMVTGVRNSRGKIPGVHRLWAG